MENSMEVPQKTKNTIAIWSNNPILHHNSRQNCNSKRYMLPMFIAVLFAITKTFVVVFQSHSVVSNSLEPPGLQHTRLPCPSPSPRTIHVHWVSDVIEPSHPLSSPSPPVLNLSQHQGLLQWVTSSHQVAKVAEFQLQHQSFQWISELISFRTDWFDLLAVQQTLKSLLQCHSSKHQFFSAQLSL